MYTLLNYQRVEKHTDLYSEKLAKSMHLALKKDDEPFQALNSNFGILFAKAYEDENEVLHSKSLINSWLFKARNDEFAVVAVRVNPDGTADEISKGCILVFESKNLLSYTELPLLQLSDQTIVDVTASYDPSTDHYVINWQEEDGSCYQVTTTDFRLAVDLDSKQEIEQLPLENFEQFETDIEGVIPRNTIEISDELGDYLIKKLVTPHNIEIQLPESIEVSSVGELATIKATAVYSDGTTSEKKIDWYADQIDFSVPGEYEIKGKVYQDHFPFPIAWNRADPCVGRWNGKYYFIATNDADGNNSLYIREADTIPGLVTAQEVLILDTKQYPQFKCLLWAPEFHILNDRLYIFHAGSPGRFEDQAAQVMRLKEGGNPMIREDWEMPRMVVKKDGTPLIENGITLDMTVIPNKGRYFVSWSHRPLKPYDLGAWICIAEADPNEPWKLISDIVTIAKPDYGWDNNHTPVVEGPYPLIRDGKIFLTISGAAVDSTYVVGLLTADIDSDLLEPSSWVKTNYPLLTLNDVEGEYGPGHNAYVTDEDGNVWNTYHARPGINAPRSSGIRRVHFDVDGYPILALTEEKDLNPDLAIVTAKITVK
ncbi:MAG: family 43 glycosylhydrolase [Amphibacillus sp.]|nr:family 43 glycosylhydrolase [Amphibacillus sp.]